MNDQIQAGESGQIDRQTSPLAADHLAHGGRASPAIRPTVHLEALASELEMSADYRILRRLKSVEEIDIPPNVRTWRAVFLDVETTGLDPDKDAIIELAMLPFEYGEGGQIYRVHPAFSALRDPGRPIPAEITALTGITNDMVDGKSISVGEVDAFVASANIAIAHNSSFDRRFMEVFSDVFRVKPWACSWTEVPWVKEGFEGTKLSQLAAQSGFFYDGHQALADCMAGVELLRRPLPRSGRCALSFLLESARQPRWRVWAEKAPFEFREGLKKRGYRWNQVGGLKPKAWYVDVSEADVDAELKFLRGEVFRSKNVQIASHRLSAFDRYSKRC